MSPTVIIIFIISGVLGAMICPPSPAARPKRAKPRIRLPTPIRRQRIDAAVMGAVLTPFTIAGIGAGAAAAGGCWDPSTSLKILAKG